jgi:hypothetical protein
MSPEKTPLRDSELKSKALENQEDWDRPSIKNLALRELLWLGGMLLVFIELVFEAV